MKPLNSALATNMALSPGSRRKRAASQIVDHNRASDAENESGDDLSELTKPGKASKAAKRRRMTPVRSYPTRERTKAEAEAGAAEVCTVVAPSRICAYCLSTEYIGDLHKFRAAWGLVLRFCWCPSSFGTGAEACLDWLQTPPGGGLALVWLLTLSGQVLV